MDNKSFPCGTLLQHPANIDRAAGKEAEPSSAPLN